MAVLSGSDSLVGMPWIVPLLVPLVVGIGGRKGEALVRLRRATADDLPSGLFRSDTPPSDGPLAVALVMLMMTAPVIGPGHFRPNRRQRRHSGSVSSHYRVVQTTGQSKRKKKPAHPDRRTYLNPALPARPAPPTRTATTHHRSQTGSGVERREAHCRCGQRVSL